jgi:hypothetical protein
MNSIVMQRHNIAVGVDSYHSNQPPPPQQKPMSIPMTATNAFVPMVHQRNQSGKQSLATISHVFTTFNFLYCDATA